MSTETELSKVYLLEPTLMATLDEIVECGTDIAKEGQKLTDSGDLKNAQVLAERATQYLHAAKIVKAYAARQETDVPHANAVRLYEYFLRRAKQMIRITKELAEEGKYGQAHFAAAIIDHFLKVGLTLKSIMENGDR